MSSNGGTDPAVTISLLVAAIGGAITAVAGAYVKIGDYRDRHRRNQRDSRPDPHPEPKTENGSEDGDDDGDT